MPAPKAKSAANGKDSKAKPASVPSTNGTTTPLPSTTDKKDTLDSTTSAITKPNKETYDAEQNKLKADIDALQVKLSAVKDKISLATKSGSGNDRRNELRAELDSIRGQQGNAKSSRGQKLDRIKALQENVQKKIKDLQAAKNKAPYKTVADVDAHIRNLEKQIESGSMKLADEKRALQEISTTRRNRRLVEGFQADEDAIQADKAAIDEIRKELDDPEAKAVSERFDTIRAELDELKRESDEAYAGRSKLFEERDNLQNELSVLYNQKREGTAKFREDNDRYWTKVNEDRARRAERERERRAQEEAEKKREIAERLREEAEAPAFQNNIEDCQTLIDFFSGKSTNSAVTLKTVSEKPDLAGIPKLELRKVEALEGQGLVEVRKKKGDAEEPYFFGGKGKSKGKKTPTTPTRTAETAAVADEKKLNLSFGMLSALTTLAIPPPTGPVDLPRVVEDLKTKKAWYEANQARVTAENIQRAEANIQRLNNAAAGKSSSSSSAPKNDEVVKGEVPAEPKPTPVSEGAVTIAVPSDVVAEELVEEGVTVESS